MRSESELENEQAAITPRFVVGAFVGAIEEWEHQVIPSHRHPVRFEYPMLGVVQSDPIRSDPIRPAPIT